MTRASTAIMGLLDLAAPPVSLAFRSGGPAMIWQSDQEEKETNMVFISYG